MGSSKDAAEETFPVLQFFVGIPALGDVLDRFDHAEKLALREVPAVKTIIQRLEAEKVSRKPSIDGDALLADF